MNKTLYWILSLTWGCIMTLIGLIVSLVLICCGFKPKRFGYTFYFEVGENWGGLELGAIFIVNKNPSLHIKCHEHGHGLQNCIFGPLEVFIGIASAARYHWRNFIKKHNPQKVLPPYDSIWFEGQATELGTKAFGQQQ